MRATSITQSVQTLQSNILQHVHHRALLQNVGQPTLQEEQLFFIQLPFLDGASMTDDHKVSAITVGIVHASLLEHERVLEVNATSKEQQLIVLSGDYYSGRYYQLLAQSGNIRLIQKLSKGIVDRCEHQIRIYETETRSVEEWIRSLTVIESVLISQYYDVYGYNAYTELMETTLTFIRLKKEYGLIQDAKQGFLYKALALADNPAVFDSTLERLHEQLIARKQRVLEVVKQSHIHDDLKQSIEQYITL